MPAAAVCSRQLLDGRRGRLRAAMRVTAVMAHLVATVLLAGHRFRPGLALGAAIVVGDQGLGLGLQLLVQLLQAK